MAVVPSYREFRPPPALAPVVACAWENEPAEDHTQRIVPDGCIDLIWEAGRELVIAGADTGARTVALPAGTLSSGVRLRPGAAGAFLGMPASELRDRHVAAALVWGEQAALLEAAVAEADPRGRLRRCSPRWHGAAWRPTRWWLPRRSGSGPMRRGSPASRTSSG